MEDSETVSIGEATQGMERSMLRRRRRRGWRERELRERRFDQGTLRILNSILASQHAQQSKFRNNLFEFIRSEAKLVVEDEIIDKSVEEKLFVLQLLVRVFALSNDV
ncbi:hypothetical protein Syun_020403 [Stephania yunnanensis]|uniref:Uncharacterized protein n=1 Tax=Stephania yunnanensis TaxID=152371 RepID=A0AAP0NRF1_9MAGN